MSSQIDDVFQYQNKDYNISAIENPDNFFNINDYGIPRGRCSSACWRGYMAIFGLDKDKRLILIELYTSVRDGEMPPEINGVSPDIIDMHPEDPEFFTKLPVHILIAGNVQYSFINLPIQYSGKILITEGFIDDYYVHMGFQPPSSYGEVLELTFAKGTCVDVKDVSGQAEQKRLEMANDNFSYGYDPDWIEKSFNLDYDSKWSD